MIFRKEYHEEINTSNRERKCCQHDLPGSEGCVFSEEYPKRKKTGEEEESSDRKK